MSATNAGKRRARDAGIVIGLLAPGPHNAITDVPGVRVGHRTVWRGDPGGTEPVARTGLTAIIPHQGDLFRERLYAGQAVFNGYGEMTSKIVIDEWGLLGSPVILTDTVSIGRVYDATVAYMMRQDPQVGDIDVVIPVVAECDDGFLNDNRALPLTHEDVVAAIEGATAGPVSEGCVGAGTGTQQFDFKGGIGTASRVVEIQGTPFTVGVLLNTNYGTRHQLCICGVPVGRMITDLMPEQHHDGSCIGVVATDAPLHPRQLQRLAKRIEVGLVRTGSVGNDGSGEIFLAFSTANRIPRRSEGAAYPIQVVLEGAFWTQGAAVDHLFEAVADATEEAALNALFQAVTVTGRDGHVLHALPVERTLDLLRRWHPL